MKAFLFTVIIVGISITIGLSYFKQPPIVSPVILEPIVEAKKFDKYTYEALRLRQFEGSKITIDKEIKTNADFTSSIFHFYAQGKKVGGLINIPNKPGEYPVIIMIRGFVDPSIYEPGVGTSHGGEVLAQNGFITLAPDFLGYGTSDKTTPDNMEDRFLSYVTVLELLSSVKNLNTTLTESTSSARFDTTHIGLWGHSNGGQIALSVLEMSGKNYPTVLWAPVSKPFPYSILYYTDDIDDHGKALRKVVADFELKYDAEKYSLTNYLSWIKTPLQIHQGASDGAVAQAWSDTLTSSLKKEKIDVEYFVYPGEDHNFAQGSWNTVIQRTIEFYKKQFASKGP